MDFELTEEQKMLKTTARDFLTTAVPKKLVRDMVEDEVGYPPAIWKKMAKMGWMGLLVPEEYGGIGGSLLDLAIVLEEMGRACLPGPFFSTMVLGGLSLIEAGNDDQKRMLLPELADGKLILTLALTEPGGGLTAADIKTRTTPDGKDGFTIQGTKLFVPDAHTADRLICVTRTNEAANPEDGITLFLVDRKSQGISYTMLKALAGDKQFEVVLDDVKVPANAVLGEKDKGWRYIKNILEKATALRCAEMLGGARQVLEMSITYAGDRVQFGHPIGSFQAIQHTLANMSTDIDACSLLIYESLWRLSQELPASQEVSMTKALISEIFREATASAHQIHGAIGFTQDHDLPLYFKRAKAWELSFGDASFHLDKVATEEGL